MSHAHMEQYVVGLALVVCKELVCAWLEALCESVHRSFSHPGLWIHLLFQSVRKLFTPRKSFTQ